jgi:hypothetical protein
VDTLVAGVPGKSSGLLHILIERRKLALNVILAHVARRNRTTYSKNLQQVYECGSIFVSTFTNWLGTVTMRQMIRKKPLDGSLVERPELNPFFPHPACKMRNAAQINPSGIF